MCSNLFISLSYSVQQKETEAWCSLNANKTDHLVHKIDKEYDNPDIVLLSDNLLKKNVGRVFLIKQLCNCLCFVIIFGKMFYYKYFFKY